MTTTSPSGADSLVRTATAPRPAAPAGGQRTARSPEGDRRWVPSHSCPPSVATWPQRPRRPGRPRVAPVLGRPARRL